MATIALQLSYTDPATDVQAPAAYARVITITVDAVAQTVDVGVGLYATAAARVAGSRPFATFHAWPDYVTLLGQPVDVRAAAYAFLKTLGAFSGATDV